MKIRINENLWEQLVTQLWKYNDVESAGLLMGNLVDSPSGKMIIVKEAIVVPDEAYLERKIDQISIDPIHMNRLTKRARDNNWCVLTIHTHPNAIEPWFSGADDYGDSRLMPSLHCQILNVFHGSLVIVKNGKVKARVFSQEGKAQNASLWRIGKILQTEESDVNITDNWFSRQTMALGESGQRKLKQLRVGVVGLGGIGSLVCMQLAHLGVGQLVLIDGDKVEASNISRIVGSTQSDVGRSFKVDVAKRYVQQLGLTQSIEVHNQFLTSGLESTIASCDIVISCVDMQTPRALLNRLSYQYLFPLIDLGIVFRVNDEHKILSDAGRVVTIGPGKPCLACWGHLDPDAMRLESLNETQLAELAEEGYIEGANIPQPSVIGFNTFVAGSGITEMLRLVTAFAGSESPPKRLAFSFRDGVVKRNVLAKTRDCRICAA